MSIFFLIENNPSPPQRLTPSHYPLRGCSNESTRVKRLTSRSPHRKIFPHMSRLACESGSEGIQVAVGERATGGLAEGAAGGT